MNSKSNNKQAAPPLWRVYGTIKGIDGTMRDSVYYLTPDSMTLPDVKDLIDVGHDEWEFLEVEKIEQVRFVHPESAQALAGFWPIVNQLGDDYPASPGLAAFLHAHLLDDDDDNPRPPGKPPEGWNPGHLHLVLGDC
jgi:hypothetical protein